MEISAIPPGYQPPADLLRERVILITGAGDGLGRAAALACARHGASVILLGRTVRKLEKVYDEIEQAGGPAPAIYPMNLIGATWNDHAELATTIEREFGRLDGLLHCAAHFKAFARLEDLEPREWMDSLQVNLTAPYTLTRLCLPLLRAAPDASVVHVTDAGGRDAKAFNGIYGIAKRAAEGMMQTWAAELASEPGLRFNSWYPGPLRTGLRAKGYMAEVLQQLPPADSAANAALWLLGPDSRGYSGKAF